MSISAFSDKVPQFSPGVFVHPAATIIADADLEPLAAVRGRYTARGRLYAEQGLGADLSAFTR